MSNPETLGFLQKSAGNASDGGCKRRGGHHESLSRLSLHFFCSPTCPRLVGKCIYRAWPHRGCGLLVRRNSVSLYSRWRQFSWSWMPYLHQIMKKTLFLMSDNATVVAFLKNKGGTVFCHVQARPGDYHLVKAEEEDCAGRPVKPSRSDTSQGKVSYSMVVLTASARSTAILTLFCLPAAQTQSSPFMCCPFWI